jgi:hypothetical protein
VAAVDAGRAAVAVAADVASPAGKFLFQPLPAVAPRP